MFLGQHTRAIGAFPNRYHAEYAPIELNISGFPASQISVIARDIETDQLDNEASICTIAGSMLGAIGGCLVGLGILAIPGVGFLVAAGTSGSVLAGTLVGAGVGVASGGLIEALASLRMTTDRDRDDVNRLFGGEYLVIVNGTVDEVRRAETILSKSFSSKVWVC